MEERNSVIERLSRELARSRARIGRLERAGKERTRAEEALRGEKGQSIAFLNYYPFFDREGKFGGSLCVGTDISSLKQAEDRLEASLAERSLFSGRSIIGSRITWQ
jgi:hypothetical protein